MYLLSKSFVLCISLLLYNAAQIIALPTVDEAKPKPAPTIAHYKSGWCGLHVVQGDNQCKPDMWRCTPSTLNITVKDAAQKEINHQNFEWTGEELSVRMPLMKGNPNNLYVLIDAPQQTDPEEHLVSFRYGTDEWSVLGRQGATLPYGAKDGYRCKVGFEDPPTEVRRVWERRFDCGFRC
ncbi:hypothetical protein MMC14_003449 [Varicellaria rhodocarpa]|nr:hypothetical protein [Varicellaria rhodocarpa]